jgi:6-phosphogluconolactonase
MERPLLKIFDHTEELFGALVERVITMANIAIDVKGQFNVVLSPGDSPRRLFELLASPEYRELVNWSKVYFFFVSQSCSSSGASSVSLQLATHFDPLDIPSNHIFTLDPTLEPEQAARAYMDSIKRHFNHKPIEFDCVLLGLGDQGNTASLYPYTSVLSDKEATVKAVFVQVLGSYHISFTAPLINQAKEIIFIAFGQEKAAIVRQVLAKEFNMGKYPAQLIQADYGSVYWYLDQYSSP